MGHWHLAIFISFLVMLIGLSIHWSVVLIGALLPFVPMVTLVLRRRRERTATQQGEDGQN